MVFKTDMEYMKSRRIPRLRDGSLNMYRIGLLVSYIPVVNKICLKRLPADIQCAIK